MATTVKITETYDLKTTVNQLGLIAVHTPAMAFLKRMYPGLVSNHKFVRVMKCDVIGACATVLPADPLQVGVSEGTVAPEDMFNPILYRALSNDGFETILNRMYSSTDINQYFGSVATASTAEGLDPFKIYYSLLAENKGWRKVMPQNGFSIRGLYPICYTMINTFGNTIQIGQKASVLPQGTTAVGVTDDVNVSVPNAGLYAANSEGKAYSFRGRSVKMPRVPLHISCAAGSDSAVIPKTFVLGIIIPPARLHEFYYRMRVTWTVRFEEVVSAAAIGDYTSIQIVADSSYSKSYEYESSEAKLENVENTVDTNGVQINKIMES